MWPGALLFKRFQIQAIQNSTILLWAKKAHACTQKIWKYIDKKECFKIHMKADQTRAYSCVHAHTHSIYKCDCGTHRDAPTHWMQSQTLVNGQTHSHSHQANRWLCPHHDQEHSFPWTLWSIGNGHMHPVLYTNIAGSLSMTHILLLTSVTEDHIHNL